MVVGGGAAAAGLVSEANIINAKQASNMLTAGIAKNFAFSATLFITKLISFLFCVDVPLFVSTYRMLVVYRLWFDLSSVKCPG